MIRALLANRKHLEKVAVIDGDRCVSRRELANRALSLQTLLPQTPAAIVAVFLPNGSDYMAAFFGTIMHGLIVLPLSTQMTQYEIAPLLTRTSAVAIITLARHRSIFEDIAHRHALQLPILCMDELPPSGCGELPQARNVDKEQPMVLLGTSGTTGQCKIVQLSEQNIAASVLGYLGKMGFDDATEGDTRFVLATPFSSIYGIMILCACLIKGFPVVALSDGFTLDSLYTAAEKHKATHYEGGQTTILLMEQWIGRPIPYDLSRLTYFGFGGAKVPGATIERLLRAYPHIQLFQGYGMTEAGPLITKHPRYAKLTKYDSVGSAILGMQIEIEVDGTIAQAPYTKGEIIAKGPGVMLGYYKNEAETRKALKNGYLYTGDIGYMDEDGHLYICGRKKALILVRGFNVHPEEVEECIRKSGLAKDCFVYGDTDSAMNETVCADVVPVGPHICIEDIRAYCHTHLAAYKQPSQIRLCSAVKKTATGKTERVKEVCPCAAPIVRI